VTMGAAPRRLSVTFFDAYPHVLGGSHQISIAIARELRSALESHFLTTAEGPFTDELDRLGFPRSIVRLPQALSHYGHSTTGTRAVAASLALPEAWRRIATNIPRSTSVLHVNDLRGATLAGPAARLRRVPILWHVHLGDDSKLLNRFAASCAAAIIVPDASTVASAPGVPAQKLQVVPNAVQREVLAAGPVARGRSLLVTASRIVPQKGIDILLEAVSDVKSSVRSVRLQVYGGDQRGYEDYAHDVRSQVRELRLEDTVTILGHHDRPYRYWTEAALYVQASRWENFPVAVLEAMALGLPVVGTTVGAMPRIVDHEKTGLLVPPNDPQALAGAINHLLKNPEEADAMGVAGRERAVEDFAPSTMADRILSIYEDLSVEKK
jgi:glycosyltransferase involved in cell wall biosynthesis